MKTIEEPLSLSLPSGHHTHEVCHISNNQSRISMSASKKDPNTPINVHHLVAQHNNDIT